ncbi:MAG: hypothetical protein AAGB93_08295 [Planctomycetota bacterium]
MTRQPNGPARRLGRLLVALSCIALLGACRSTTIQIERDATDVKEFFVVVDDHDKLKDRFKDDDQRQALAELAVNLDDDEVLDYAEFRLEVRDDKADIWREQRAPRRKKWFQARIQEHPSKVVFTIARDAFKNNENLAAGIIVRVDSPEMAQDYYGTLLRPEEIAVRTTALVFHAGPTVTLVLKNSSNPALVDD